MDSTISKEVCIEIIKNFLRTSKDVKFISSEFKPISDNIEGFMGEHYKLIINFEFNGNQQSEAFFVKTKPKNKTQVEIADGLELYKREIFAYDILMKEFDNFGYDIGFAAKSYYCIPGQTLIMENVTLNGFSITDRHTNLTVDHLKCALKSLAMFHAAGYAYQRTKSKQLKKTFILGEEYYDYMKELFYIQYIDKSLFSMKWWKSNLKTLTTLIDLLPEDETYKQEFKNMVNNSEIGKAFVTKTKINKTCGHGDLWSNNMLFKYENNIPVQCCLVDFQICRYFYPAFDVLLAIFSNTNSEFRKQHLNELFSYYHKTLGEILKTYGCDIEEIHPADDFYETIDLLKFDALMQVILTVVITYLPKEKLTEKVFENDEAMAEVMFENDVMAAEAFKKDEGYRNIVSDTIYDLRDALLKKCHK